jgi:hypothetical protein
MEETLAPERVEGEVAYFQRKEGRGFERTYGWAWLLKLAAELETWDGPEGGRWARQLQPLTEEVVGRFRAFLPVQAYPIRSGVHANTAFSLSLALDYGREALNEGFETLLMERARTYFIRDRSGALGWEPGGEDFLSPCLEEAALMAKVLAPEAFGPWLEAFLPEPAGLEPARVADRTDPRIVHLDGLNLSRARALGELAAALEPGDRRRAALEDCALRHARTSLPQVLSGHYEGEHWLATFAVGLLAPGGRVGGHSLM